MEQKEFIGLYNRLMNNYDIIDELYAFNCLKCSGFSDSEAYELKSLLNELWLKDENDISISKLSDMLYEYVTKHKGNVEIPTRKLLVELYEESE